MPLNYEKFITLRLVLILIAIIAGLLLYSVLVTKGCIAAHNDAPVVDGNTRLLEAQHGQAEADVYVADVLAAKPADEKLKLWKAAWAK